MPSSAQRRFTAVGRDDARRSNASSRSSPCAGGEREAVRGRHSDRGRAPHGERADRGGDLRSRRTAQLDFLLGQAPLVENDDGVVLEPDDALGRQVARGHAPSLRPARNQALTMEPPAAKGISTESPHTTATRTRRPRASARGWASAGRCHERGRRLRAREEPRSPRPSSRGTSPAPPSAGRWRCPSSRASAGRSRRRCPSARRRPCARASPRSE